MIGFLDILGVHFRVVYREDASWPSGQQGLCDHGAAQITLSDRLAPDVERNTLLHEMIHAIAALQGMDLTEAQASVIATGLSGCPQLSIKPGK